MHCIMSKSLEGPGCAPCCFCLLVSGRLPQMAFSGICVKITRAGASCGPGLCLSASQSHLHPAGKECVLLCG